MESSDHSLTAQYAFKSQQKTFTQPLPSLTSKEQGQSVKDKTAYLGALRSESVKLQAHVNTFLTEKMEEDKTGETTKGTSRKTQMEDERAEEMYGEEEDEASA